MQAHTFNPTTDGTYVCVCGKGLYHEEHYNGSRSVAALAYRTDTVRRNTLTTQDLSDLARAINNGCRIRIADTHPYYGGRIARPISYTSTLVTVNLVQVTDLVTENSVQLQWAHVYIAPMGARTQVPQFASQQEADEWLERNNPVPAPARPVPHFASAKEADAWIEEQRALRRRGKYSDLYEQFGRLGRTSADAGVVMDGLTGALAPITYTALAHEEIQLPGGSVSVRAWDTVTITPGSPTVSFD